ncbi:hypothetical protein GCM10010503_35480 [Streptomyces lucensis JCM 4490]|uniref:Uncharacterized protein n=1 Tax=Streptomyces lucensis JCM 4490 TaxID=1306176 RepID=A0A918MS94_9ACTN|nr:hypothetical protein [Streptomyces lucensis]GGW55343.1 hypothetical protein GCM10010503_35480 [Streptomyces lucensis JCM 4490]
MFQDTPIYTRLVAERGDVPARVRGEAERIHHDLARVMPPPAPHSASGPSAAPAAQWLPAPGLPAGRP